ncbi:MAG: glutathione S-transferase family protein [Paracoccaceae bacterium]
MYVLQAAYDFASFPVHIVLEELGVPYRLNLLDIDGGDLDKPEHRALHPFGKIPAIVTPDGPMFETAAILLWLADRHGALAPAQGTPERSAFLSWYFFTSYSLHTGMMELVHAHRPGGEACAPAISATARPRLAAQLATMDKMVATEKPAWLSPDQPSILGYYLGTLMRWMRAFPTYAEHSISSADYPALRAVLQAMEQRPAAVRAAAEEGITGRFFSDPEV